jgi:peptidoglycan/xylan/chitin deacetylase (PgdA/CDA1 family)
MSLLHNRAIQRWAMRHVRCRFEGVNDRFAITFDDGPSATNTPRLLDLLARHGARATFFVLAGHALRHPDLVRRSLAEGHEVGLHGHYHLPPLLLPDRLLERELRAAAGSLERAFGVRPRWYRAPFGLLTPAQAEAVTRWGFSPVLGDVYPEDAQNPGAERIVSRTLPRLRGGSILILHDASVFGDGSREQTIAAADGILRAATERGLRAVPVGELAAASGAYLTV